jgi:hypothetical protein
MANIPSLPEEKILGWDSAFCFPWLNPPNANHNYGCNFFIQYKLSELCKCRRSNQWDSWRSPYFRFMIPHNKRRNGINSLCFDQYKVLKKLSEDYLVYYVTCETIERSELFQWSEAGELLRHSPTLSVSDINNQDQHIFATYSADSNNMQNDFFILHSNSEKVKKQDMMILLKELLECKKVKIEFTIKNLSNLIIDFEKKNTLNSFQKQFNKLNSIDGRGEHFWTSWLISKYLKIYYDLYWRVVFY